MNIADTSGVIVHKLMLDAGIQVRKLCEHDSMEELTNLLHRAYARLAEMGFRYYATFQSPEITAERCAAGETYVAEQGGKLIATVTLRPSAPTPNTKKQAPNAERRM